MAQSGSEQRETPKRAAGSPASHVAALAAVVALHTAASALFMIVYCRHLGLDARIAFRHVVIVLAAWSALLGACGLCIGWGPTIGNRRSHGILAAFLWAAFTAQVVIYTVDWFAVPLMGDTVTFGLFAAFALQLGEAYRLSPAPLPIVLLYTGVTQCACILAAWRIAPIVSQGADAICARANTRTAYARAISSAGLLAAAILPISAALYTASAAPFAWAGEPFTGLSGRFGLAGLSGHEDLAQATAERVFDQYPKDVTFEKRDVVLIFIDDLRADHMSLYGYDRPTTPFLDSLKNTGKLHRVDMALAVQPSTKQSIASTLSSRYVPSVRMDNVMLTDVLHNQGYAVSFIVSGEWGQYGDLDTKLCRGFYRFIEGSDSADYPIGDDRMVPAELSALPDHGPVPACFFLSLLAPHGAGYRQERFKRFTPASMNGILFPNETTIEEYRNHYDNGIVQTDALLEELFDILRAKGILENGIVVIFSDHGEELGEHGKIGHGGPLCQTCLHVPLLIYEERPVSYANLAFASLVDIPPTVLDRLGLPLPSYFEGQSLLVPADDRVVFHFSSHAGSRQSWAATYRKGDEMWKYIRETNGDSTTERFFDLGRDPREHADITAAAGPEVFQYLKDRLTKQFARWQNETRFIESGFTYQPTVY